MVSLEKGGETVKPDQTRDCRLDRLPGRSLEQDRGVAEQQRNDVEPFCQLPGFQAGLQGTAACDPGRGVGGQADRRGDVCVLRILEDEHMR